MTGGNRVCQALRALRLKVNEEKTVYLVCMTSQKRRIMCKRRNEAEVNSVITLGGQRIRNKREGKCLGVWINDDLTWRKQVETVVLKCKGRLHSLWKCTNMLTQKQRKEQAEGTVLSLVYYCLEVVSTGRPEDLVKLQGIQSKAAQWVLQTRKRDWSLRQGLRKLGWLSVAQMVAYKSVSLAVTILRNKKPERLYRQLTDKGTTEEERVVKKITEEQIANYREITNRAWSVRSLRWIEKLPEDTLELDMDKKGNKKELKDRIKHIVNRYGDRILEGKTLELSEREVLGKQKRDNRVKDRIEQETHADIMVMEEGMSNVIMDDKDEDVVTYVEKQVKTRKRISKKVVRSELARRTIAERKDRKKKETERAIIGSSTYSGPLKADVMMVMNGTQDYDEVGNSTILNNNDGNNEKKDMTGAEKSTINVVKTNGKQPTTGTGTKITNKQNHIQTQREGNISTDKMDKKGNGTRKQKLTSILGEQQTIKNILDTQINYNIRVNVGKLKLPTEITMTKRLTDKGTSTLELNGNSMGKSTSQVSKSTYLRTDKVHTSTGTTTKKKNGREKDNMKEREKTIKKPTLVTTTRTRRQGNAPGYMENKETEKHLVRKENRITTNVTKRENELKNNKILKMDSKNEEENLRTKTEKKIETKETEINSERKGNKKLKNLMERKEKRKNNELEKVKGKEEKRNAKAHVEKDPYHELQTDIPGHDTGGVPAPYAGNRRRPPPCPKVMEKAQEETEMKGTLVKNTQRERGRKILKENEVHDTKERNERALERKTEKSKGKGGKVKEKVLGGQQTIMEFFPRTKGRVPKKGIG